MNNYQKEAGNILELTSQKMKDYVHHLIQENAELKAENDFMKEANLELIKLAEGKEKKIKKLKAELEENEMIIYNLRNENERMEQIYRDAEENNKQLVELALKQKKLFGRF